MTDDMPSLLNVHSSRSVPAPTFAGFPASGLLALGLASPVLQARELPLLLPPSVHSPRAHLELLNTPGERGREW